MSVMLCRKRPVLRSINVVLENAGSLTVVTGSRAVDTIINANGKMDVYGKDVGTVLNSSGTQTIYALRIY